VTLDLFAVVAPGLEDICAAELAALPVARVRVVPGGVEFVADLAGLAAANLRLATATRVLVRLGEFHAPGFPELHARSARLAWERHLRPGDPVAVHVTARRSRLYHTGGIAERVLRGLGERLGAAPEPAAVPDDMSEETCPDGQDPEDRVTRIVVRLERDVCTVSVDSSGAPLHRRGYRLALARAPLRPTLAAGVLRLAGWAPGEPLLDPFCGSGTLPIEAARWARGTAPGQDRGFAFARWPGLPGAAALAAARADLPRGTGPGAAPAVLRDLSSGTASADLSPGTAADLSPGTAADLSPGTAADLLRGPSADRRGTASTRSSGPAADLSRGPAADLPRGAAAARSAASPAGAAAIAGSDRDAGAVAAARANAARAGVADAVEFALRSVSDLAPPAGPGLVVSNPPYGVRVGKRGPLRDLYARLGEVLRARCPGWRVALLCGDDLWRCTGLPLSPARALRNGGLPVALVRGRVPA
jgi:putative N6-adenine-specific DNA methylase